MLKKMKNFFLFLGVVYIVIGALGISNMKLFNNNIDIVLAIILLLNGCNHILYSFTRRKNPYFQWGVVFCEGVIEIMAFLVIFFKVFSAPYLFIGVLFCAKGVIMVLGRNKNITNWEGIENFTKVSIIFKGFMHFLFGSLMIVTPFFNSSTLFPILGWYILFVGINFITLNLSDSNSTEEE
ncbi:MAG: DUF308 domain-containing protein [Fusobacteriaceae bacterium]